MTTNVFDPSDPLLRINPYPIYDRLRSNGPLAVYDPWGMSFLTRHEDCNELLRDHRIGHGIKAPAEGEHFDFRELQFHWMLMRDPPDHTRLRGLVHKAFTSSMVERLRGDVQRITDRLLDQAQKKGEFELLADFASPLTVTVIATMLGIPEEDHDKFSKWSHGLAKALDIILDPAIFAQASEAAMAFRAYLRTLLDERRAHPREDLLSALAAVEVGGDILTNAEMEATCALLLAAGHETTFNLIGNGTLALLRNPDQLRLLQQNPGLIPSAVEEFLRFDSPVQMTTRIVLEDIQFGDLSFQAGRRIAFLVGSANHDPRVFDAPERLDVTRKPNPHLSFSSGIHYCLGAPLARLQGQIAFETLLSRMPNLSLRTDQPVYRDSFILRGLEALPLSF